MADEGMSALAAMHQADEEAGIDPHSIEVAEGDPAPFETKPPWRPAPPPWSLLYRGDGDEP